MFPFISAFHVHPLCFSGSLPLQSTNISVGLSFLDFFSRLSCILLFCFNSFLLPAFAFSICNLYCVVTICLAEISSVVINHLYIVGCITPQKIALYSDAWEPITDPILAA